MTIAIDMHFYDTVAKRLLLGHIAEDYAFQDWFKDPKAITKAQAAPSISKARRILQDAYKGPDANGVSVVWMVKEY